MPTTIHIEEVDKCSIEIITDSDGNPRLARLVVVRSNPHIRVEYNFERLKIIATDLDFNISLRRYLRGRWERLKLLFK